MRGKKKRLFKAPADAVCLFCQSSEQNEEALGKMLYKSGLTLHYFCMLFSSGLWQRGKREKDGILGFMPPDIRRERKRGIRLSCQYCKKKGATIGCVVANCRKTFHFPCGKKAGAMCQFFDEFRSYCPEHRPRQCAGSSASDRLAFYGTALSTCSICMMAVEARASNATLRSPCCKSTWFHRDCMQKYALSAGRYFFKCPLCNNKDLFEAEMLQFGIYIPDQDAAWELEPNAYHELLERYSHCDAPRCLCPQGRQHDGMAGGRWELVLCSWCGSSGSHVGCSGLARVGKDNICSICAKINNSRQKERGNQIEQGSSGCVQRGHPATPIRGRGQGTKVQTPTHDSTFSSGLSAEESSVLLPDVVLCRIDEHQESHDLCGPCNHNSDVGVVDEDDDDDDDVNIADDEDVNVTELDNNLSSGESTCASDATKVEDEVSNGDATGGNSADDCQQRKQFEETKRLECTGGSDSTCDEERERQECTRGSEGTWDDVSVFSSAHHLPYHFEKTAQSFKQLPRLHRKWQPGCVRKHLDCYEQHGSYQLASADKSLEGCSSDGFQQEECFDKGQRPECRVKAKNTGDNFNMVTNPKELQHCSPEGRKQLPESSVWHIKKRSGRPKKCPDTSEQNSPDLSVSSSTLSASSPDELYAKIVDGDKGADASQKGNNFELGATSEYRGLSRIVTSVDGSSPQFMQQTRRGPGRPRKYLPDMWGQNGPGLSVTSSAASTSSPDELCAQVDGNDEHADASQRGRHFELGARSECRSLATIVRSVHGSSPQQIKRGPGRPRKYLPDMWEQNSPGPSVTSSAASTSSSDQLCAQVDDGDEEDADASQKGRHFELGTSSECKSLGRIVRSVHSSSPQFMQQRKRGRGRPRKYLPDMWEQNSPGLSVISSAASTSSPDELCAQVDGNDEHADASQKGRHFELGVRSECKSLGRIVRSVHSSSPQFMQQIKRGPGHPRKYLPDMWEQNSPGLSVTSSAASTSSPDELCAQVDGNDEHADTSQKGRHFELGTSSECKSLGRIVRSVHSSSPQFMQQTRRGPGRPRKHCPDMWGQNGPGLSVTSSAASTSSPDKLCAQVDGNDEHADTSQKGRHFELGARSECRRLATIVRSVHGSSPQQIKRGPGRPRKYLPDMWEQNSPGLSVTSSAASTSSSDQLCAQVDDGDEEDADASQKGRHFELGTSSECKSLGRIVRSVHSSSPQFMQQRKRGRGRPRKTCNQNSPQLSACSGSASTCATDDQGEQVEWGDWDPTVDSQQGKCDRQRIGLEVAGDVDDAFDSFTAVSTIYHPHPSSADTALVQGKVLRSGKLANLEHKHRRYRKAYGNMKSEANFFEKKGETVLKGSINSSYSGVPEVGAARHIAYQCFVSSINKRQQAVENAGISDPSAYQCFVSSINKREQAVENAGISDPSAYQCFVSSISKRQQAVENAGISDPSMAPLISSLPQSTSSVSIPSTNSAVQTATSTRVPVSVVPLSASSFHVPSTDCMQSKTSCALASSEQQAASSLSLQAPVSTEAGPLFGLIDTSTGTLSHILIPQPANPQHLCPQSQSECAPFSAADEQGCPTLPVIESEVSKNSSCFNPSWLPLSRLETSSDSHSDQEPAPLHASSFQSSILQDVYAACSSDEVNLACLSEEFNPACSSQSSGHLPAGMRQAKGPVVTSTSTPVSLAAERSPARGVSQTSQHSEDGVWIHESHQDTWSADDADRPVPVSLFAHDCPPTPSEPLTSVCQPDLEIISSTICETRPWGSSGATSTSVPQHRRPQTVLPMSRGKIWLGSVDTIKKLAKPHAHVVVDSDSDVEDISYCIQQAAGPTFTAEKSLQRGPRSVSTGLSARSTEQRKEEDRGLESKKNIPGCSSVSSRHMTSTCTSAPARMLTSTSSSCASSQLGSRWGGMTTSCLSNNRLGMAFGCPHASVVHRLTSRYTIPHRKLPTTSFIDLTGNDCESVGKTCAKNSVLIIESSDSDVELIEQN